MWPAWRLPAVNIFPAPETTTTLQSGFPAISLKRSTISLGEKKVTSFPQYSVQYSCTGGSVVKTTRLKCEKYEFPGKKNCQNCMFLVVRDHIDLNRFLPPESAVHGISFLRTVKLYMCDELCWVTDGQGGVRRARPAGGRHGSHRSLSRQPQTPVWEETHAMIKDTAWFHAEPRQRVTRCRYNIIILLARWCCNINYAIMSYILIYLAARKGIPARPHFSYILLLILQELWQYLSILDMTLLVLQLRGSEYVCAAICKCKLNTITPFPFVL